MAANNPFSDEEKGLIVQWIREGVSSAEIAARFGRPRNSISRLAKKLGVPLKRTLWSDLDIHTAYAMREQGKSYTQIADALGRTLDAVKAFLKRDAVQVPPKPEKITDLYILWRLKMANIKRGK